MSVTIVRRRKLFTFRLLSEHAPHGLRFRSRLDFFVVLVLPELEAGASERSDGDGMEEEEPELTMLCGEAARNDT